MAGVSGRLTAVACGGCVAGGALGAYPAGSTPYIPVPTLYSGAEERGPSRLGALQLALYNMSSQLAGVAAGYDVRLSNVSPVHPRLIPAE